MNTDLYTAILNGDVETVKRLLDSGADPNERYAGDEDYGSFSCGLTVLMVAAASPHSNIEIVKLLLDHGADLYGVSDGEVTAAFYAAGGGKWARLPIITDEENSLLGEGDVDRLRLLLDRGLDASEAADNGRSLIYEACTVGDPKRVGLLLERGASPHPIKSKRTKEKRSKQFREMEKMLSSIDKSMRSMGMPTLGEQYLCIPLYAAAESGNAACVQLLVDAGVPAIFENAGDNALFHAGSPEVVDLLMDLGVPVKENGWGRDPSEEAVENERYDVAERIWARTLGDKYGQSYLNERLLRFSGHGMDANGVKAMLRLGADAKMVDKHGRGVLHETCWQGDGNGGRENEVVRQTMGLLIDAGADVNLQDEDGNAPLHEAVFGDWGSPTSTRVLLERGAIVDLQNNDGETPLMLAVAQNELECCRLLIAAGADLSIANKQRRTVHDYAKTNLKTWQSIAKKPMFKWMRGTVSRFVEKTMGDMTEVYAQSLRDAEAISELIGPQPNAKKR